MLFCAIKYFPEIVIQYWFTFLMFNPLEAISMQKAENRFEKLENDLKELFYEIVDIGPCTGKSYNCNPSCTCSDNPIAFTTHFQAHGTRHVKAHISYVQTVPNHRRLLIIDDKSLPHKQRRAFTRLLIFKIKFSSEPPSRWLAGSAEMTPVIGNARRVCGEVTLTIKLVD